MIWSLGKHGEVELPGPFTDFPDGKVHMDYLDKIIEEAKRIGVVPWCVSSWHELAAAKILGYEIETRKEFEERMHAVESEDWERRFKMMKPEKIGEKMQDIGKDADIACKILLKEIINAKSFDHIMEAIQAISAVRIKEKSIMQDKRPAPNCGGKNCF